MEDWLTVAGENYKIIRLLGRGKGGYTWLAERDGARVALKQIHHEPCDYYQFGDKIEAELRDYERLLAAGIPIPKMLAADRENERLVKELIDGPTIHDLVRDGKDVSAWLPAVREMAAKAKAAGLNIDYFPTNFMIRDGQLVYVDYECNPYMDEWNFENWGVKYWSRTEEFMAHLQKTSEELQNRLLEGEYRIVDILPRRVPEGAEGQFFAVEKYFREPARLSEILRKHAEILLKLNCYYDLEASFDGCESWERNPAPERLAEQVAALAENGFFRAVFPSEEAMIDIDSCDTWMTVYGGGPVFLETVAQLSAAAGFFLWEPRKD